MGHALLNIEVLYLGSNMFFGVIPDSISNCSKLTTIDLAKNHFSGTIPTSLEPLTRARFEELNNDLFRKTMGPVKKAMEDAGLQKNQIDEIVLVFEGERSLTKDNRGTPEIEVTFEVDANGILNVKAEDKASGRSEKITITNDKGRLSQEEIQFEDKEVQRDMKLVPYKIVNKDGKPYIQVKMKDGETNKGFQP
nr:luminal-binding protein 4 [Ipomoea batatas]